MRIQEWRALAACGFLLLAHGVLADEVVMNNGDRLTGTIKTSRDGKLVLETTYAGEIEIQITQIQRMVTDNPVTLVLEDDTRVSGILSSTDYGRLQATLQFNFDRNNAPAENAKKNDYETLITGGYTW